MLQWNASVLTNLHWIVVFIMTWFCVVDRTFKTSIINELTQFPFIWTHTGLISATFVPRNQSLSPWFSELRTCVKVKVAVLGSPPLISSMVFVDIKQHWRNEVAQSSGAVWKLRWPSSSPRPNKLCVFCGRKTTLKETLPPTPPPPFCPSICLQWNDWLSWRPAAYISRPPLPPSPPPPPPSPKWSLFNSCPAEVHLWCPQTVTETRQGWSSRWHWSRHMSHSWPRAGGGLDQRPCLGTVISSSSSVQYTSAFIVIASRF